MWGFVAFYYGYAALNLPLHAAGFSTVPVASGSSASSSWRVPCCGGLAAVVFVWLGLAYEHGSSALTVELLMHTEGETRWCISEDVGTWVISI